MKQLTMDVFTSAFVMIAFLTQILSFVPVIIFSNPVINFLPVSPLIAAVVLMIAGALLDVFTHHTRAGSLLVIFVHGFAYWLITPNIVLLALFTGMIVFGQFVLKE